MAATGQWPIRRTHWTDLAGAVLGRPLPGQGTLVLRADGCWMATSHGQDRVLHLVHAWQAWAWLTLRLDDDPPAAAPSVQVTIWKAAVPEAAWRQLCLAVARQLALPRRAHIKEAS